MAKIVRLYQKIRNGPNSVSPEDLHTLLVGYGFDFRDGSKHWRIYWHEDLGPTGRVTVPFRRPLKAYVVKQALRLIEQVESQSKEE